MRRKAVLIMTVTYAALVCWRITIIFGRDSIQSPSDHSVSLPSGTASADQRERALEAKRGAIEAWVIALPWVMVLNPASVPTYVLVLSLNVATVFGISAWLLGPLRRRPK
jgi:hypothetical protein